MEYYIMKRWLKQNITIMLIVTGLGSYGAGAAFAALLRSDVTRLNNEVFGSDSDKSLAMKIVKLDAKIDKILYYVRYNDDQHSPENEPR